MSVSICYAEAEAYTQFTIFALFALKKQCLIFDSSDTTYGICRKMAARMRDDEPETEQMKNKRHLH